MPDAYIDYVSPFFYLYARHSVRHEYTKIASFNVDEYGVDGGEQAAVVAAEIWAENLGHLRPPVTAGKYPRGTRKRGERISRVRGRP